MSFQSGFRHFETYALGFRIELQGGWQKNNNNTHNQKDLIGWALATSNLLSHPFMPRITAFASKHKEAPFFSSSRGFGLVD